MVKETPRGPYYVETPQEKKEQWSPIPKKDLLKWFNDFPNKQNTPAIMVEHLKKLQKEISKFDKNRDVHSAEMIQVGIGVVTRETLAFPEDMAVTERRDLLEYLHKLNEYFEKIGLLLA